MNEHDIEINELVTFVVRETGWTLEYICSLPAGKLRMLVDELHYQKAMDEYRLASNFAMIIASWANAQSRGRRYGIKDFVGEPPQREEKT